MKTQLRGIAWDHSRAFPPLVAAAQRYGELHPGVDVIWQKRSLHDFGHADVATLARSFDLLIVDHPFAGEAIAHRDVLMLQDLVDPSELAEIAQGTMGPSYASYIMDGNLIALPIDVATQVACARTDLLAKLGKPIPEQWTDVLDLAKLGAVTIPGFHVDVLLSFLGMCVSVGACMFTEGHAAEHAVAKDCLQRFAELARLLPEAVWGYNPIAVYEQMAQRDDIAYCPFAYSYANYSRACFGRNRLQFADLVDFNGIPLRGVLGGTGVAISSQCASVEKAVAFATYLASEDCQRGVYFMAGGQPASEAAWNDELVNEASLNFFRATARSTREAWVRPRYAGYIHFQERAGIPIVQYLRHAGNEESVLAAVDAIYQQSLRKDDAHV